MLGLAFLATAAFQAAISLGHGSVAVNLAYVAAAACVAFLVKDGPAGPEPYLTVPGQPRGWIVSVALAAVGTAGLTAGAITLYESWSRFGLGVALLVGGTTVLSLGLCRFGPRLRAPWSAREGLVLVAILGLGTGLRFFRLGTFPPPDGFCLIEEAQAGQAAHDILAGSRPWEYLLDVWLAVPSFAFSGETITNLRIPYDVVACLTVLAVYLLLAELVSRPAALFATALFAVCRWHITVSRYGHWNFPSLLLFTLAFAFALRAHRRASEGSGLGLYPWIGLLCGLMMYAYTAFRVTPVFLAGLLVFSLASHLLTVRGGDPAAAAGARRAVRTELVGLLVATVCFAAVALPLVDRLRGQPNYYFDAFHRSGYDPSQAPLSERAPERLKAVAGMFNHEAIDAYPVYNVPGTPMVDPVTGLLLSAGVFFSLRAPRRLFRVYFALLFLAILVAYSVFVRNLDHSRFFQALPFLFVLIAFLVDALLSNARAWGAFPRRLVASLLAVGFAIALFVNARLYFGPMSRDPRVRAEFYTAFSVVIAYGHTLPDGAYLHLAANIFNYFQESDYAWWRGDRIPGRTSYDLTSLLGVEGPVARADRRLLMEKELVDEESTAFLRAYFPESSCADYVHPNQPAFPFLACRLGRPSEDAPLSGVIGRYEVGREVRFERREPGIAPLFIAADCSERVDGQPCRAVWEGDWQVPRPGAYSLELEVHRGLFARVFLEDEAVKLTQRAEGEPERYSSPAIPLTEGGHRLRVEVRVQPGNGLAGVRIRARGPDAVSRPLAFGPFPAPVSSERAPGTPRG